MSDWFPSSLCSIHPPLAISIMRYTVSMSRDAVGMQKASSLLAGALLFFSPAFVFAYSFTLVPTTIATEADTVSVTLTGGAVSIFAPGGSQTEADCVSNFGSTNCDEVSVDTSGGFASVFIGLTGLSDGTYTFLLNDRTDTNFSADCEQPTSSVASCSGSTSYGGQTELLQLGASGGPGPSPAYSFVSSSTLLASAGVLGGLTTTNIEGIFAVVLLAISIYLAFEVIDHIRALFLAQQVDEYGQMTPRQKKEVVKKILQQSDRRQRQVLRDHIAAERRASYD